MQENPLQSFLSFCKNKRIAVLGMGISNRPLVRLLLHAGLETELFDRKEAVNFKSFLDELKEEDHEPPAHFGTDYLSELKNFDLIFRTPFLRPDTPELLAEKKRGAIISSEMEAFLSYCPAEVCAVTGSDGKSTTATLMARMLKAGGYTTFLGGNIGTPLLDQLASIRAEDKVVLELSSFQLLSMSQSPQRSVVTNISPNHLDMHKSYAEYVHAKKNIYLHQHLNDRLVLNGTSDFCAEMAAEARGRLVWAEHRPFGTAPLYGLEGDTLYFQAEPTAPKEDLLQRRDLLLPGRYNAVNVLAAFAAVDGLVSSSELRQAVKDFKGVEHRVELIAEARGLRYYDSSIDSSPNRSLHTLSAFREQGVPVVMICGGKDKNCLYDGLGPAILDSCRGIIFCGANAPLIRADIEKALRERSQTDFPMAAAADYKEALKLADGIAQPGDAILLSPAGTSFDRFANFNERGDVFKAEVRRHLKE